MNKIDIPKTQSVTAVIFTPITGAIGIAVVSFNYINSISHWTLACLAFVGAFLGVEAVGGACCYSLIKCHREKNYGADFWTALAGAIAYIGGGILTLWLQSPIIIFFVLSPFAYFSYSILRTMADEITAKTQETEAQIKLLNAQKNFINAQNRRDKARSTPPVQDVQNGVLNDLNAQRQVEKLANLERVLDYLASHPEASLSAIGEHIGKTKGTAGNYTNELMEAGRLTKNGHGWEVIR
jgi:hypothetical protein